MELSSLLEVANTVFTATLILKAKFKSQVGNMTKINSAKYLLLNLEVDV